jgi:predicted NBD/HSP70 family sugar kinase
VINTLNPSRIYVGGEITELWDQVEPVMRRKIRERALTAKAAETPLVPEPASSYPRLRGATAIVAAPVYAAPQVA